eukprot:2262096-Prorocentrum_lima.AAC.1
MCGSGPPTYRALPMRGRGLQHPLHRAGSQWLDRRKSPAHFCARVPRLGRRQPGNRVGKQGSGA